MQNFKLYTEEQDYFTAISIIETGAYLNEGFFDNLKQGIKDKIEFIKSIAEYSGKKLDDVVKLFKDSRVYKFFSSLNFSLEAFFNMIKTGFKAYGELQKVIAEYISKMKIMKITEDALKGLDDYLVKHPKLKHLAGFGVSAMLLYIWMNMSFTGDFSYDFDFADILNAVAGKFTLNTLFAGADGTRMLILFATGVIGLSFPWPGPTSTKMVVSLLNGLRKLI